MFIILSIIVLLLLILILLIWPIILLGPYKTNEGLRITQPTTRKKHIIYSWWSKNPFKNINSYIKANVFNNLQVNNLIIDNNLNNSGSLYILMI